VKLFDRIFGKSLDPAWEFDSGAAIWKLQVTAGGLIVGEARDVQQKHTSLFSLRPSDGTVLFRDRRLREPWWIALEMVIDEMAVLHQYPKPDLPTALGATVVDCNSGEILWEDDAVRILCGAWGRALLQRGESIDHPQLQIVDIATGELLEDLGADLARAEAFRDESTASVSFEGWTSARPLEEDAPEWDAIAEALAQIRAEPAGPLEYATVPPYLIVSTYTSAQRPAHPGGACDGRLLVARDHTVVFSEIIAPNTAPTGADQFFVLNRMLMFVRNSRTLAGIDLRANTDDR
jgi:hypothetical protein